MFFCNVWYNCTMSVGKRPFSQKRALEFRRELAYLYARREAVDKAIASLEAYGRYQPKTEILTAKSRRNVCS